MNEFAEYLEVGFFHVLDFGGYDHILFLIVLSVAYQFRQLKKVVWLITFFTVAHSITLALSAFEIINVNPELVEFLIPLTICIRALLNIFNRSSSQDNQNLILAIVFGLIHGLGFSNYFKEVVTRSQGKLLPLLEFTLGVELAQIDVVIGILLLGVMVTSGFKIKRNIWVVVTSSIVLILALELLWSRIFW